MISLEGVQRRYPTRHGNVTVLRDVNFNIQPGEKVGIVGRNGAGKSTMIRLISGAEKPDAGSVRRSMSVSWPLAFAGGFQGTLTGLDNLRFICRIYGKRWRDHIDYVEDFTELGRFLNEPLKTYSSGMRSRLAFAMSMVIDFDCFLIDEIMAVGDHRFHERCHIELFEKRAHHAMIFVSHDAAFVRSICNRISVLESGFLHNFDDLDEAFAFYYRPQAALAAPNLLLPMLPSAEDRSGLSALLFGPDHAQIADLPDSVGNRLVEWLLGHPLTQDPEVARYRLNRDLTPKEFAQLQIALDGQVPDDFGGRSLHSALAALAESRIDCPISQQFLSIFEAPLPMDGAEGLWHRMSTEGGSIRRAASFVQASTGRELPLRLDFHRAETADYIENELAEFTLCDNGVTCRLRLCMTEDYLVSLAATYPFLLAYFAQSDLSGTFGLSLGDEGLTDRVLSFCSAMPGYQVPDPLFVSSRGYEAERETFEQAMPWDARADLAYWRGTDKGTFRYRNLDDAPRVILARLSNKHPKLINAKISRIEPRPDWEAKKRFYEANGLMSHAEPLLAILDYRYQIDVDGNSNSWSGLFLKLLSGSPVLKLDSEMGFRQWYYDKLIPWTNYVPVSSDGSDLVERIAWLRQNPLKAEQIGQAGRELALSITYDQAIEEAKHTIAQLVAMNRRLLTLRG